MVFRLSSLPLPAPAIRAPGQPQDLGKQCTDDPEAQRLYDKAGKFLDSLSETHSAKKVCVRMHATWRVWCVVSLLLDQNRLGTTPIPLHRTGCRVHSTRTAVTARSLKYPRSKLLLVLSSDANTMLIFKSTVNLTMYSPFSHNIFVKFMC